MATNTWRKLRPMLYTALGEEVIASLGRLIEDFHYDAALEELTRLLKTLDRR